MAVRNVECQLAEMQIARYVSGDPLSSEALRQLERHVADCDSCARVLADRRKTLKSMLANGYAAVTTDFPTAPKENLLMNALKEQAETAAINQAPRPAAVEATSKPASRSAGLLRLVKKPGDKNIAKPLMYSAALAVVLFAMGYVSRGSSSFFGGSADNAFPATDNPPVKEEIKAPFKAEPPSKAITPAALKPVVKAPVEPVKPADPKLLPTDKGAKNPGTKAPSLSPKQDQVDSMATDSSKSHEMSRGTLDTRHKTQEITPHRKPHKRVVHASPVSQKKRHAPPTSKIRVYDESGNPLGK